MAGDDSIRVQSYSQEEKEMKTIEEHNQEILTTLDLIDADVHCPRCGKQLCYVGPFLKSVSPCQRVAVCWHCKYSTVIFT
jgi:hypothetical protein